MSRTRQRLLSMQKRASWMGAGIGAGVGALGGAAAGGPDNRLGGALIGAGLGAGAGAGGHHLWKQRKLLQEGGEQAGKTNLQGKLEYTAPTKEAPSSIPQQPPATFGPAQKIQQPQVLQQPPPLQGHNEMAQWNNLPRGKIVTAPTKGPRGKIVTAPTKGRPSSIPYTPPQPSAAFGAPRKIQQPPGSTVIPNQHGEIAQWNNLPRGKIVTASAPLRERLQHMRREKLASEFGDYVGLAEAIRLGAMGKHAQAALEGVEEVQELAYTMNRSKIASDPWNNKVSPLYANPEAARELRLHSLLGR